MLAKIIMEYFDLNVTPSSDGDKTTALSELIANLYTFHQLMELSNEIKLEYDEDTKTLVINDEEFVLKLSDFIGNNSFDREIMDSNALQIPLTVWDLTTCITSLHDSNVHIKWVSPISTNEIVTINKDGMIDPFPCLAWACDNKPTQITGTIFTLTNISRQELAEVKSHFVCYELWKHVYHTKDGDLLISNDESDNGKLFVNGYCIETNNQVFIPLLFNYSLTLTFSMEMQQQDVISKVFEQIINILQNLDAEDKLIIYQQILDHFDDQKVNEAQSPNIRGMVLKYFGKLNPYKYLIINNDPVNQLITFAQTKKKVIINTLSNQEFNQLNKEGVKSIVNYADHYFAKNYVKIDPKTLNGEQSFNWIQLKFFFNYLAITNQKVKDFLIKEGFENIPLTVVETVIDDCMYDEKQKTIIISKTFTNNLYGLFTVAKKGWWDFLKHFDVYDNLNVNLDDEIYQYFRYKLFDAFKKECNF